MELVDMLCNNKDIVFDILEGVKVMETPIRLAHVKKAPKEHKDYTSGEDLEIILGGKMSYIRPNKCLHAHLQTNYIRNRR